MAAQARVLLRKFREANGIPLRKAAEALGVAHPTLIAWEAGHKTPRECYREAIERWTRGKVPADAWEFSKHEARAQQNAARVQPFEAASKPAA